MKKNFPNVSLKLSLYYMAIFFVAAFLVSSILIYFLTSSVRKHQTTELKKAQEIITEGILSDEEYFDVPYNILYSVFDTDKEKIIFTNDPLLPVLVNTNGNSRKYYVRNFFTDGDLNILYISSTLKYIDESYLITIAMDIDKDYATEMIRGLPKTILFACIPVLIICFIISVFITAKIMEPFEREKQFSNDVSHELKTPLSIINGHVSLLLRWGKSDSGLLDESLNEIKRETKSMQKIIESLLQIGRYESGRLQPEISEFSVKDFFERLKKEFSYSVPEDDFTSENVEFQICVQKDFTLKSDEELLHQIFVALISNSIKYNQSNCVIKLIAEKKGKTVILKEEDNGIGLDEKIIPFIFDRFYRGDSSHNQEISGNGLGLSIVKTLVTALKGKITAGNVYTKSSTLSLACNEQKSQGASFKIEL